MNATYSRKTPRAAFAVLAIVATVALAAFVDFLATDYALDQRAVAQSRSAPVQPAELLAERR